MPPARSIFIDTNLILTSIATQAAEQHAAVTAEVPERVTNYWNALYHISDADRQQRCDAEIAKELGERLPEVVWVPRNLESLTGKRLTASGRIRAQQAVRQLEAGGLVMLEPRFIRLTDAGNAYVARLQAEAAVGD